MIGIDRLDSGGLKWTDLSEKFQDGNSEIEKLRRECPPAFISAPSLAAIKFFFASQPRGSSSAMPLTRYNTNVSSKHRSASLMSPFKFS